VKRRSGLAFAALDFTCCVALWALVQVGQPPRPADALRTSGEYAVVLTWPTKCDADLDLYIRQPTGAIIYFKRLNGSVVHLEHDDIPALFGYLHGNRERAILRVIQEGEYTVNVQVYQMGKCSPPVAARVELWKLRGRDRQVYAVSLSMSGAGNEKTAFRFSLRRNGDLFGINRLSRYMVKDATPSTP
jgi:hypothetical protein